MIHYLVRCKHCGKEYSYQASGYGCHDLYNNDTYCPECYKAMILALEKIPIRYIPKFRDINETKLNITYDVLLPIKQKYIEDTNKNNFPIAVKYLPTTFKNGVNGLERDDSYYEEEYIYNYYAINVIWYKNKPNDKKIFILSEFDNIEKCFTNKFWYKNEKDKFIPTSKSSIYNEINRPDKYNLGDVIFCENKNDVIKLMTSVLKEHMPKIN